MGDERSVRECKTSKVSAAADISRASHGRTNISRASSFTAFSIAGESQRSARAMNCVIGERERSVVMKEERRGNLRFHIMEVIAYRKLLRFYSMSIQANMLKHGEKPT